MVMNIFFIIFAAVLLLAVGVGLRDLRREGIPRGSAQLEFGPDGSFDLHIPDSDHGGHCDYDGGHCGFDGGGGHH